MEAETLRERILDVTWDHAVHLGIPGHQTDSNWPLSTDPEVATILAGIFDEARLSREWTGWLRTFGDKLHTNRLKKMLNSLLELQNHGESTGGTDSLDDDLPDERINPETIEDVLAPLKFMLRTVQEQTNHSFGPALEMLETVNPEQDFSETNEARMDDVSGGNIVPNVPVLFWRHIAGVNARSALLWAVGSGWSGNNKRASEELFLPLNSVKRARRNLNPTGYITVDRIDNSKVISRGPRYHDSVENREDVYFMNWFRWIRAVLNVKPLIDKNIDRDLRESLEERFTETIRRSMEQELLAPAFTHRHGDQASHYLLNRIFREE